MRSIPGAIPEKRPENSPPADKSFEGTDTDHNVKPDVDASAEPPHPTPTNLRSTIFDLRQNLKPKCNEDYRY